jgi:hypothetical protein
MTNYEIELDTYIDKAVTEFLYGPQEEYGNPNMVVFQKGIFKTKRGAYSWIKDRPGFSHECYITVGGKDYHPDMKYELDVNGQLVILHLWDFKEEWKSLPAKVFDYNYYDLLHYLNNSTRDEQREDLRRRMKEYDDADTVVFGPLDKSQIDEYYRRIKNKRVSRLVWDASTEFISASPMSSRIKSLMVDEISEESFDYIYTSEVEELTIGGEELYDLARNIPMMPRPGRRLKLKTLICQDNDTFNKVIYHLEPSELRSLYVRKVTRNTPFLKTLQSNIETLCVTNSMEYGSEEMEAVLGFKNLKHLILGSKRNHDVDNHVAHYNKCLNELCKELPGLETVGISSIGILNSDVKAAGVPRLEVDRYLASDADEIKNNPKVKEYLESFEEVILDKCYLPFKYNEGYDAGRHHMMSELQGITIYDHFNIGNDREYYDKNTAKLTSILLPVTGVKSARKVVR